ncbi:MAG TPA: hypothetical protein ENL03_06225 [Phycisphaerae bacterium]|nr:hypothetical protein [Phycisphaerae bacterium]
MSNQNNMVREDGVVCEAAWEKAKVKVFHLMKEKTQPLKCGVKLGQLFLDGIRNNGDRGGIAYKLAARTIAIMDGWEGKNIRSFDDIDQMIKDGSDEIADALKATAIANIIKSTTKERTSDKRLKEAMACDSSWHEQIKKAKPNIVLCAGPGLFNEVWNYLSEQEEENKRPRPHHGADGKAWGVLWEKTSKDGLEYFLHDNCVYLQFYHPSYYGKKQEEFHDLLAGSIKTVRRAFNEQKLLQETCYGGRLAWQWKKT